jgi:hypothetical protein
LIDFENYSKKYLKKSQISKIVLHLLISKPKIPLDLYKPTHLLTTDLSIPISLEIEQ